MCLTTPQFGSGQAKEKKSNSKYSGENGTHDSDIPTDEQTHGDSPPLDEEGSGEGEKGFEAKGNAEVEKDRMDLFQENEVTLSVAYSGGGQGLKQRMLLPVFSNTKL